MFNRTVLTMLGLILTSSPVHAQSKFKQDTVRSELQRTEYVHLVYTDSVAEFQLYVSCVDTKRMVSFKLLNGNFHPQLPTGVRKNEFLQKSFGGFRADVSSKIRYVEMLSQSPYNSAFMGKFTFGIPRANSDEFLTSFMESSSYLIILLPKYDSPIEARIPASHDDRNLMGQYFTNQGC